MVRLLTLVLMSLVLSFAPACTTNPATGQRQFNVLSEPQERAMGEEAAPQFLQEYGGPIPSPEIQQYVSDLGQRLAARSERPDLDWEFFAVDSAVINAFALPGGKVFITRGLMAQLKNEAMLAGVLGHEIGHVTAEHIGQQMSQQLLIQGLATAAQVAGEQTEREWLSVLGLGTQVGGGLYLLRFGRGQETQADELGLRYMTELGYNPVAQIMVMEVLAQEAGGPGGPEWLSTHPYPETRINHLDALIRQRYPDYDEGRYQFHEQRYQNAVLDTFQRLPPPKHTAPPQGASAEPAATPAVAAWASQGCPCRDKLPASPATVAKDR